MENQTPTPTPLGTLTYFPSEIRDLIWLQFIPSGHENNHPKTDLSILRTSHAVHDEVSRMIYDKSHLEIDISPEHEHKHKYKEEEWKWMTVQFSQRHYHHSQKGCDTTTIPLDPPQKGRWVIRDIDDAESRGFYALPFHRMDQITVRLEAPRSRDAAELFTVWRKVTDLVELLQHASAINNLTIYLVNGDGDDRNWLEEQEDEYRFNNMDDPNHDMVIVPFCTLQNLQQVHVEAPSSNNNNDQTKTINWNTINWATEILRNRNQTRTDHDTDILDRKCAEHYYHLHTRLWILFAGSPLASKLRLRLLREWVAQSTGDKYHERSDLEKNMTYTMDVYPDIIEKYDPDMAFLIVMLISGHYAQLQSKSQATNGSMDMDADQEEVWNTVFPNGIPSMHEGGFDDQLDTLVTRNRCSSGCTKISRFLLRIAALVTEWEGRSEEDWYEEDGYEEDRCEDG